MTGYKSPPRNRTTIRVHQPYATLERAARQYLSGKSWKAIGAEIDVSAPVVRRAVAAGIYPADNAIRAKLGLPVLAEVEVCPVHGVAHSHVCKASRMPAAWAPLVDYLRRHEQAKRRAEARVYGRYGKQLAKGE